MNITEEFIIDYFSLDSESDGVDTIINRFNLSKESLTLNDAQINVKSELCKILSLFGVQTHDFAFYGSTNLGLSLIGDYDLDITVMLSEKTCDIVKKMLHPKPLNNYNIAELFYNHLKTNDKLLKLDQLIFKKSVRCPTISFRYKPLKIQADFTINNWLGVENTKLLEKFLSTPLMVKVDKYFSLHYYVLLLRIWFKSTLKSCEQGFRLPTYGFTIMIIHFLITKSYLPSIMSFNYSKDVRIVIDDNHPKSYQRLIYEFFYYYVNEFDPQRIVVSIDHLTDQPLTREDLKNKIESFLSSSSFDHYSSTYKPVIKKYLDNFCGYRLDYNAPLIVQDPFELSHNLAKAITSSDYKRLISSMNTTLKRFAVDNQQHDNFIFNILYIFDRKDSIRYSWIELNKGAPHFSVALYQQQNAAKVDIVRIFWDYLKRLISILLNDFVCTVTLRLESINFTIRVETENINDDIYNQLLGIIKRSKLLSLKFDSSMQRHWWKHSRRYRRLKNFSNSPVDFSTISDQEVINYQYFCRLNPFTWSFDYFIKNLDDKSGNFVDFCALLNKKFKNTA